MGGCANVSIEQMDKEFAGGGGGGFFEVKTAYAMDLSEVVALVGLGLEGDLHRISAGAASDQMVHAGLGEIAEINPVVFGHSDETLVIEIGDRCGGRVLACTQDADGGEVFLRKPRVDLRRDAVIRRVRRRRTARSKQTHKHTPTKTKKTDAGEHCTLHRCGGKEKVINRRNPLKGIENLAQASNEGKKPPHSKKDRSRKEGAETNRQRQQTVQAAIR